MFTDIEGFTALMQADEERALATRAKYVDVLTEQHDAFGGTIVQYFGDGSLSIFPNSVDAVSCAIAAQQAFRLPLEVPVRVGVHVGNVIVEPTGVIGDAVNIASRIESFGFPGAVMISDSVQDQVKNQAAFELVDLGSFRLKNVARPFSIFAVDADGLAVPAPTALHGKGDQLASLPSNLPDPASTLVGREEDLAALTDLVATHRVVTITGPGGIGKTSTAIEVCRQLMPEFLDGTSYIPMADVRQVEGFIPAIADVLDVKEAEGRSLSDGITALIGDKKVLLCVDNVEQVIDAAPRLASLVAACPHLRLIVTSRGPLRIGGEYEYRLEPLSVPSHPDETGLEELRKYPAIELFVERARSVNPGFALTSENAAAVTEVCKRMDGLPLAIELAAARIRILTPEALLDRLEHALDVLTGGRRDVPDRQKTLRAAIDWSYSLLSDAEKQLLNRMAVFASGATIGDIEAVCSEEHGGVIGELEALIDNALVAVAADRFSLLQTVKEFAAERLGNSGDLLTVTDRFADHYAALAERIGAGVEDTDQLAWMERGVAEESNIHAALDHLARQAGAGNADACERGMTANGDLWIYWHIRGRHVRARDYSVRFIAASAERTRGRGKALNTAGISCLTLGRSEEAMTHLTEAYAIAEELGDTHTQHAAAVSIAVINMVTDVGSSMSWAKRSIAQLRELDHPFLLSLMLSFDGVFHAIAGDNDVASLRLEEALAIQEERGDQEGAGISLAGLAMLANVHGRTDTALDLYARSLAAYALVGDRAEEARVLDELAWTYLAHGNPEAARSTFFESARAYEDIGSVRGVGISLVGLAAVKTVEDQHHEAMVIAFAAERFSEEEGVVNVYSEENPGRAYLDRSTDALSTSDLERARSEGHRLSLREALQMGYRTRVDDQESETSI
jgi:predicted ATPase